MTDEEWLAIVKKMNLREVVLELLQNRDFFMGDGYYRDIQETFFARLEELTRDSQ